MKPTLLKSVEEVRAWRRTLAREESVGFAPTMGALHEGHAELLRVSKAANARTVLSIFVNPTQFNNADDLKHYPVTIEKDLELAEGIGVDAVWLPEYSDLYSDQYRFRVTESRDSTVLCGAHRPGHFDGVLTVVLKLFMGLQPHRAYFGEKDFQQFTLVRDMAKALLLPIDIIGVPTVREADGLAMSSRNLRLTAAERELAPAFHRLLASGLSMEDTRRGLENLGMKIDYIEDRWNRRLGAVHLGAVRLIDNVELPKSESWHAESELRG